MINLIGFSDANNKFYIKAINTSYSDLDKYKINGEYPERHWCKDWFVVYSKPIIITTEKKQPSINERYELKDVSLASDKIPLILNKNDVTEIIYHETYWKNEYAHLSSLYKLVCDIQPPIDEEVEFTYNHLLDVTTVPDPINLSYTIQKTNYINEGTTEITRNNLHRLVIDTLLFPEPLLPARPCSLTSKQMFDIVREFINNNIDPKVARVTLNCNFCYKVVKKIKLDPPITFLVDINLFTKKKPKYEQRYRTHNEFEIFEMTNENDKYNDYTPISPLYADSEQDLKDKLDNYLNELITFINTPVNECPRCKGKGVIVENFEHNK